MMSAEYKQAYDESAKAIAKFKLAQVAYRTMKIADAEFLAARAEYDAAMQAYDIAYAKWAYEEMA